MSANTQFEKLAEFLHQNFAPHLRTDAIAHYYPGVNNQKPGYAPSCTELTRDDLFRHLTSEQPIGLYILQPDLGVQGLTLAAVVDIDDKKKEYSWQKLCELAHELNGELAKMHLHSWPCRSGSGHGIHLWLFWATPQHSTTVRRILKSLVEKVIGEKLHVDIFPNQDHLREGSFGSLVALPLSRGSRPIISLKDGSVHEEMSTWLQITPALSAPVGDDDSADDKSENTKRKRKPSSAYKVATLDEIQAALGYVPADDYEDWYKVGFALKEAVNRNQLTDAEAEAAWREWSKKSEKYDERAQDRWWLTQHTDGEITLGTIFHLARKHGWEPTSLGGKRVIQVIGGGLSDQATAGEEALIAAGAPFYQRSSILVRPIVEEVEATGGRRTQVAHLAPVLAPHMVDWLCRSAKWARFDPQKQEVSWVNPPTGVANVILNRWGEWTFPKVVGIITTPTLRPDGTLLHIEGYDEQTSLLLVSPPPMPEIPAEPTKEEGMIALAMLEDLLDEFPFVKDEDRSVALSALLTPVVRGAFPVAPMHAIRAPSAGSGKSFLLDLVAAIATGQLCPVMAAGRSEEETEKRLGAALLAGQPIISIDNLNGDLGGDFICQLVERPLVEVRRLGTSDMIKIESRSTVFATGNNLRLVADMTRRVLLCTLDSKEERPEHRQFKRNPVEVVLEDRGKYVAAALIAVRSYIVAGKPHRAKRLASFGGWSDLVRSLLIWMGKADPVKTMEVARSEDPALLAMQEVFLCIKDVVGVMKPFVSRDLAKLAMERDQVANDLVRPDLHDALHNAIGGRPGVIDSKDLGKWLSRHKGRIARGLCLECKSSASGHSAKWWLTTQLRLDEVQGG